MPLVINEEQMMLKTSAREFLASRAPIASLRKLRDDRNPDGIDRQLWKEMAELGWAGLTISEEYGGLDFGYVGLGQILEETGRTLSASPLVSTVLLGASAISLGGNDSQKESLLPAIASGETLLALAMNEGTQFNPNRVNTTASREGNEYVINGQKRFVLDGHIADQFIILARTSGEKDEAEGLSLFLVEAKSAGIQCERTIMMDSRNAAILEFEQLKVPASALLGEEGKASSLLEQVLDIARIGLSAEMLGSMSEAFERTIGYLKGRNQFGLPIGSFQALQHRAAQMFAEIELCKSLVLQSLQAIDANSDKLPLLASMTKAKVGETLALVTNEAVQMFGGIGMTDDEEIGFFLKRARVAEKTFGDSRFHLDRYAKLNGF